MFGFGLGLGWFVSFDVCNTFPCCSLTLPLKSVMFSWLVDGLFVSVCLSPLDVILGSFMADFWGPMFRTCYSLNDLWIGWVKGE